MSLFKSSTEKPADVWFVVCCEPHGAIASTRSSRASALTEFTNRLILTDAGGEGYTPLQRGRRLVVIGPNVHERAPGDDAVRVDHEDDLADPLLHPDIALLAVLDEDEYRYVVHGPVASALLES